MANEMDIDRMCRTCLGLNGPLLTLFDGNGSGSLANMLMEFTKTKPKVSDNLPEKVCLSCISEINRCYSFKLKCEYSNQTLRQLIPNALPEVDENIKRELLHKSTQTQKPSKAIVTNVEIQTIPQDKPTKSHKKIQAGVTMCDFGTSPVQTTEIEILENTEINTINTLRRSARSARKHGISPTNRSTNLPLKKQRFNDEKDDKSYMPRRTTRQAITSAYTSPMKEEHIDDTIIVELAENSKCSLNANQEITLQQKVKQDINDIEDDTTYYEIADAKVIYTEDEYQQQNEDLHDNTNEYIEIDDTAYAHMIYASNSDDVSADPDYHNNEYEQNVTPKEKQTNRHKTEFKCPHCTMSFVFEKMLKKHIIKVHERTKNQETNVTGIIEISATDSENFEVIDGETEVNTESNENNEEDAPQKITYFCEHCHAGFALLKSVEYHLKRGVCKAETFKCEKCARVFISEELMKKHMEMMHVPKTLQCTECNKGNFADIDELNKHMISDHKRNLRNQCQICKKVFTMTSSLKDHMRTHNGDRPYGCNFCGKTFTQSANLRQHLMRHSKEKKFKCDDCGNSFVTKAELFSHQRIHNGHQPFKCDVCPASYTTSSSLVKHKRKHTGERPYACDMCPQRFAALNVLKNHRRTHTGEKPFKCIFCKKGFTQKGDCQIHQRIHTGERNYACYCGERFTHLGTLRSHQKTHTSIAKNVKHKKESNRKSGSEPKEFEVTILKMDEDGDPWVVEVNEGDDKRT